MTRRLSPSGLFLVVIVFLAFFASPALAHDVHHTHANAHEGGSTVQRDDVRSLVNAFRRTGDDNYLDQAWRIAKLALTEYPRHGDTLIDAAFVAQARHDFETAIELTRRAIAIRGDNDQAWLLLASIHLVRSEAAEAAQACRRLRHVQALVVVTCQARVALVENDLQRARLRLEKLLAVVPSAPVNAPLFAWSLSVAGDLSAAAGEPDQAIEYYTRSLELAESTQVRSALVDVLIELGEFSIAAEVLEDGAPALALDVRRMIVAKKENRAADYANKVRDADRKFQEWIAANDWQHAREMARFYLDVAERPMLARRLAVINFEIQREPEDLRLELRTQHVDRR